MEIFAVDFEYAALPPYEGQRVRHNVHVAALSAEDVYKEMARKFPRSLRVFSVDPAELPLPVILDDYYAIGGSREV